MKVVVNPHKSINIRMKRSPSVYLNQAGLGSSNLTELIDVDSSTLEDGSVLVYNSSTGKFTTTKLLDKQDIDGGEY